MSDTMDEASGHGAVPWGDLAAFLAVARHGGLSAAARAFGSSAPTLGRRMRSLERVLGRELFVRRTHGYDLTEDGRRLADELEQVERRLIRLTAPADRDVLPLVKVSAGTWTMLALASRVREIVGEPPQVRLRLLSGEGVVSMGRREAAIGFRNTRPSEDGLAGRQLRRVEFAPYALPDAPKGWIAVSADTPSARWVRTHAGGAIACETDAPRLALDLALTGVGRALLPTFLGDVQAPLRKAGEVVAELTHEQWLVTHADDRTLPEIRLALDRIAAIVGS